ncbi:MAG: PaaI family thioesterase [Burkholderiaceae bacterium]
MTDTLSAPTEASQDTLRPITHIPFLQHMGVWWRALGAGRAELILDQQPHHQNSLDMAHGGVVMTMLDVAMARAGSTLADPARGEHQTLITIEMKSTFMSPAVGRLRAEGRVIKRTSSIAFCEADLYDGQGQLAASATGTFRFLKRRTN